MLTPDQPIPISSILRSLGYMRLRRINITRPVSQVMTPHKTIWMHLCFKPRSAYVNKPVIKLYLIGRREHGFWIASKVLDFWFVKILLAMASRSDRRAAQSILRR